MSRSSFFMPTLKVEFDPSTPPNRERSPSRIEPSPSSPEVGLQSDPSKPNCPHNAFISENQRTEKPNLIPIHLLNQIPIALIHHVALNLKGIRHLISYLESLRQ